jgi:hypothetical protein
LFGWLRWLSLARSQQQNRDYRDQDERRGNDRRHTKSGRGRLLGFAGRDRERWGRRETGFDIAEGASARRIVLQTLLSNGGEGLRYRLRYNWLPIGHSIPNRRVLGQGFHQGDAKRPDVGGL